MRFDRMRPAGTLTALAMLALAAPHGASAQTANVAGKWMLEVTTDNGVTTPSVTLRQDGTSLTGHYSSETLGEADVTGAVEGSKVEFRFSGSIQGQAIDVVYEATLENGMLTGTIDIAGGAFTGTFKGTRSAS